VRPGRERLINTLLFTGTASILGLAGWLEPHPEGVGTHTALGLSPCIILTLLGLPCPMCGMTTTFALMADLRPIAAFLTQPFGVVLFLITVVIAITSALEMFMPRERWALMFKWLNGREVAFVGLLFLGMAAGWAYKVSIMSNFIGTLP
jgi:hypothetical protein